MRQSDRESLNAYVLAAQSGDSGAEDWIFRCFESEVRRMSKGVFFKGADKDDVMQTAKIALFEAIRTFDEKKGGSFEAFAKVCMRNRLMSGIRSSLRDKHRPLNDYVSFTGLSAEESGEAAAAEVLSAMSAEEVFFLGAGSGLMEDIDSKLSGLEKAVLKEYVRDGGYEGAAKALNISIKSVDNAMQRIRKKLAK